MRKIYRYRDLSFPVADNENVVLTVEFVSDGNIVHTFINIPGNNDPEIQDEGTAFLGQGKDLRNETTISVSDIANPIPAEDTITIRYKINGQLLIEHSNPKTETEQPFVILFIKFPKA